MIENEKYIARALKDKYPEIFAGLVEEPAEFDTSIIPGLWGKYIKLKNRPKAQRALTLYNSLFVGTIVRMFDPYCFLGYKKMQYGLCVLLAELLGVQKVVISKYIETYRSFHGLYSEFKKDAEYIYSELEEKEVEDEEKTAL